MEIRVLSPTVGNSSISDANAAVGRLIGLPWTGLGRATDLVWCLFGDTVSWRNYKGEVTERSEFALHLQCPFRIILDDELVLGSLDLYEPLKSEQPTLPAQTDNSTTLFDLRVEELSIGNTLSRVISATVGRPGDITLILDSGLKLEAFITSTAGDEAWRVLGFTEPEYNFTFPDGSASLP
jgi:hypothetical protein